MLTPLSFPATLLFDGLHDGFYTFRRQFAGPVRVAITPADYYRNFFPKLTGLLSAADFGQLGRAGGFRQVKGLFADYAYRGTDGLSLTYYQTATYLLAFASGEFQPARYKIYLEGVWRLEAGPSPPPPPAPGAE